MEIFAVKMMIDHVCPVCGKTVFPYRDSHKVCDECGWDDDWYQEEYPHEELLANELSLCEYKSAYNNGWRPKWLLEIREQEANEAEEPRRKEGEE